MSRSIDVSNKYSEKLIKLIPSEIIAAYLAIDGIASSTLNMRQSILIGSTIFLLILIPFYLKYLFNVTKWAQIIITMVSFLVWIFSIGGPFLQFAWYLPAYGSVILILWTLTVPLFKFE